MYSGRALRAVALAITVCVVASGCTSTRVEAARERARAEQILKAQGQWAQHAKSEQAGLTNPHSN